MMFRENAMDLLPITVASDADFVSTITEAWTVYFSGSASEKTDSRQGELGFRVVPGLL